MIYPIVTFPEYPSQTLQTLPFSILTLSCHYLHH